MQVWAGAVREILRLLPRAGETPVLSLEWLIAQCEELPKFKQLLTDLSDMPITDIPDRVLDEQRIALQAYARLVILVHGYVGLSDLPLQLTEYDAFPDGY